MTTATHSFGDDLVSKDAVSTPAGGGDRLTPITNGAGSPRREQDKASIDSPFCMATPKATPPMNGNRKRNFKIIYDPDLQPKGVPKGKKAIYRFDGESASHPIVVCDPRAKNPKYGRHTSKGKKTWVNSLRIPQFQFDKNSIGRAPASQILVSKLSTLTTAEIVGVHFKPFGDIKEIEIKVDPLTGASLGLCRIRYRSSSSNKLSASHAAREAVEKGNGMKIGLTRVTVEFDDDESKCKNMVEGILAKRVVPMAPKPTERVLGSEHDATHSPGAELKTTSPLRKGLRSTPPAAPRSEIHRYSRNASRPATPPPRSRHRDRCVTNGDERRRGSRSPSRDGTNASGVFHEIGDDPYLFIPDDSLPVKYFSSADLKRRLHRDDWRTILSDSKGFYVVFRSLRAAQACQTNSDATRMGGYRLSMILHKPQNKLSAQIRKANPQEDATNLIIKQLREVFLRDIKTRTAAPALYGFLDPVRFGKEARSDNAEVVDRERQSTVGQREESIPGDVKRLPLLPRFTKRPTENGYRRKGARPMHQMLNFYDSDDSEASTRDPAVEESDSDDTRKDSRSVSTVPELLKGRKKSNIRKKGANQKTRLRDYASSEDDFDHQKDGVLLKNNRIHLKEESLEIKDFIVDDSIPLHRKDIDFTTSEEEEDSDEAAEQALLESLMEPLPPVTESEDNISDFEEKKKPSKKQRKAKKIKQKQREGIVEFEEFPDQDKAVVQTGPVVVDEGAQIVLDLDGVQSLVKGVEDLDFLREALKDETAADLGDVGLWAWKQKEVKAINLEGFKGVIKASKEEDYFRPNPTGAARTEGYFSIPEAEKSEYLPHRKKVNLPPGVKTSTRVTSRGNRVTNRRFAADLEAQKAMLGSEADVLRFNQLKKRKKHVRFARSHIHGWGLFAIEKIDANDMIIEYVGEMIRQQVADRREKAYLKKGIGSSYLFRIDESTVIDATKKGGIARFINHCCTPNCTAKIIKVEGTRRIVIYALRDIQAGEELTYDYKFEREIGGDRIPCLCGSVGCKGFLN